MRLIRSLLALASPEYRRAYGTQALYDLHAGAAEHRGDVRYAVRAHADLACAVMLERWLMLTKAISYALRSFARTPLVTAVMLATLAVGIGANVAAFSIASGMLLRPLPFDHPERMLTVYRTTYINTFVCDVCPHSPYSAFAYRERNRTLAAVSVVRAWRGEVSGLPGMRQALSVRGALVGRDFFAVAGVTPRLGRAFSAGDERFGGESAVVASDAFWRRRFGGDPHAVGRTFFLDGRAARLVGVTPPGFIVPDFRMVGIEKPQLYVVQQRAPGLVPGSNSLGLVARMKPGVTLEQVQADLSAVAAAVHRAYPTMTTGDSVHPDGIVVVDLTDNLLGPLRPQLYILMAGVTLVLLIACFNVANLQLARAIASKRDAVVRMAIGASRRHIVGQLLLEGVLLASVSAAAGLIIAKAAIAGFVLLAPPGTHRLDQITIDWAVVAYAAAMALCAAVLTSLVPALVAGSSAPATALKSGDRAARGGASALRTALVVGQIAFAFALITECGLLVRSFVAIAGTETGYDVRRLVDVTGSPLNAVRYPTIDAQRAFNQRVHDRLAALPGVESVAFGSNVPLIDNENDGDFFVVRAKRVRHVNAVFVFVSPGYFATLGVRPAEGREFTAADRNGSEPVAVVDREFERRFARDGALDLRLRRDGRVVRVMGVVPSLHIHRVVELPEPTVYLPVLQNSDGFSLRYPSFVLRVRRPDAVGAESIAAAWRAVDSRNPLPDVRAVSSLVTDAAAPKRANALVLAALAFVALVLAVSGTASVVAYAVARRTNEIGLRIALGARSSVVARRTLRGAVTMTAVGLGFGLLLAAFGARLLSDELYRTAQFDPLTYVVVALVLAAATLVASFVPAYRAARVDPAVALRYE